MRPVVWIADDCPLSQRVTRGRLIGLGARVELFCTGSALAMAWMRADGPMPALIILDLNMPGPNGIETGRTLRDAGFTGRLVLYTATMCDETRADATAAGINRFLSKPASRESLGELLTGLGTPRCSRAA